ncbi:MAG: hypothetical protein WC612_01330 [Bdellovibrionales bacterium]|jgi:hypothetical protein
MTQRCIQKTFQKALVPVFMALFFVIASAGISPTATAFNVTEWGGKEKLSDNLPPCPDEEMAGRMAQAAGAHMAAKQSTMQDAYDASIANDKKYPKKYVRGKIMETYCLKFYLDYFGSISAMLSGFSIIEAAVAALVEEVIKEAGEWVCDYVRNAATEFLNSFCIPLPTFSFSAKLPSSSHSTCSGMSLNDAIQVNPGTPLQTVYPLSEVYQSRPMSRWLGNELNGRF